MSPSRSNRPVSSQSPCNAEIKAKYRRRVRRACDRCRIKKTKCDGSSPCLRCRTDDVLCRAMQHHNLRRRNFPRGYADMLERQQGQLVSCIQQLYQRLRIAGLWEYPLAEKSDGQPLTHDILAALGFLQSKDDGSLELETFNEAFTLSHSDNDAASSIFDGNTVVHDGHDSITDQSKLPVLSSGGTAFRSPGTSSLECHSEVSTSSRSPPDLNSLPTPEHDKQTLDKTSLEPLLSTQTDAEYNLSQAQLLATLAATSTNRNVHNTPGANFKYRTRKPSLWLDPRAMQSTYTPNQAIAPSSKISPLYHEWARSGVTLDKSDFSTDYHQLSPLYAAGRNDLGHPALALGTL